MSRRTTVPRRRRGATLLETLIAASVLVTVLIPVFFLVKSGAGAMNQTGAADSLDARARRAVQRVARELSSCTLASLSSFAQSPNWASSATLDQLASVNLTAGTVTTRRLDVRFERDPADANDGVDNDRDGLVDEGRLVMTRNHGTSSAQTTILAQGVTELLQGETANGTDQNGNALVDECGFCIERTGARLTIRLTLQMRTKDGVVTQRTATEYVQVRN